MAPWPRVCSQSCRRWQMSRSARRSLCHCCGRPSDRCERPGGTAQLQLQVCPPRPCVTAVTGCHSVCRPVLVSLCRCPRRCRGWGKGAGAGGRWHGHGQGQGRGRDRAGARGGGWGTRGGGWARTGTWAEAEAEAGIGAVARAGAGARTVCITVCIITSELTGLPLMCLRLLRRAGKVARGGLGLVREK